MSLTTTIDIDEANASLAKAKAICQLVSTALVEEFGAKRVERYCDAIWAACDELETLHDLANKEHAK